MSGSIRFLQAVLSLALPVAAQQSPWAAHWRLDESTGTVANDTARNGNDGVLKNFVSKPWVTGKFGNALSFDGLDDYVEVKPKAGLPIYDGRGSPYSIAFWVKAAGNQEDRRVYSEGNSKGNSRPLFTIGTGRATLGTGGRLHVFVRNDANAPILNHSSNATVFDDTWHHVAWVDVAGEAVLYVDGIRDTRNFDYTSTNAFGGRGTRTPNYGSFTTDVVSLGAVLRQTSCCWFKGAVDDVRVYGFALKPTDITILMRSAPPFFPPCRPSVGKFGFGCRTTRLDVVATGSAQLGGALRVQITGGPAGAPALLLSGGGPLARLDLTGAGFIGCELYPPLATLVITGFGVLDGLGASPVLKIDIPSDPGLRCAFVSIQGAALTGSPLRPIFSGAILAHLAQ